MNEPMQLSLYFIGTVDDVRAKTRFNDLAGFQVDPADVRFSIQVAAHKGESLGSRDAVVVDAPNPERFNSRRAQAGKKDVLVVVSPRQARRNEEELSVLHSRLVPAADSRMVDVNGAGLSEVGIKPMKAAGHGVRAALAYRLPERCPYT